jgi:hypothetical protein
LFCLFFRPLSFYSGAPLIYPQLLTVVRFIYIIFLLLDVTPVLFTYRNIPPSNPYPIYSRRLYCLLYVMISKNSIVFCERFSERGCKDNTSFKYNPNLLLTFFKKIYCKDC